MLLYSIEEIQSILEEIKDEEIKSELEDEVSVIIENLMKKTNNKGILYKKQQYTRNYQNWMLPNFKITELKKQNNILEHIFKHLNKMTPLTYEKFKNNIFVEIESSIKIKDEKEIYEYGKKILEVISTSSFYSEMYATLCNDLINKYDFMKKLLNEYLIKINLLIDEITITDSNCNYDEFCENNKKNEKRRSKILFNVNLMKLNVINKENILDFLIKIQRKIFENIDIDNTSNIIEELSEILYIILVNSYKHLFKEKKIDGIINDIVVITKLKAKNCSLTNKSIFRHMDILDELLIN